ncbi:hypothetical protein ACFVWT_03695 [Arthrobacter sp. NPDC058288]|uniref:hypothetical protein n=1 Tax=Arthrobacter sp. NPDC058288 TaxID=3346424 RepID=UPI0036EAFC2C
MTRPIMMPVNPTSAEVRIGQAQSANLACSGAKTAISWNSSGEFKPGLDFYNDAAGNMGQAIALQNFASGHRAKMVVVSVGGNDLGFAGIIAKCVSKFMTSPSTISAGMAASGLDGVHTLNVAALFTGELCADTTKRGPDRQHRVQRLLHPGIAAPQLLGPPGPAQLPAPGL